MDLKRIGVLGGGNIGIGRVTDLALHGLSTLGGGASGERLDCAQAKVLTNVRTGPLLSKSLPRVTRDEAMQRMVWTTKLEDVASCDFIVENVTEDWAIKKAVYGQLDRIAPPEVCFGVNTSCI